MRTQSTRGNRHARIVGATLDDFLHGALPQDQGMFLDEARGMVRRWKMMPLQHTWHGC